MFKAKLTDKLVTSHKWLVTWKLKPFTFKVERYRPKAYVINTDALALKPDHVGMQLTVTDKEWDKAMGNLRYSMMAKWMTEINKDGATAIKNISES